MSSFDKEEIQKIIKTNRSKVKKRNMSENMPTSDIIPSESWVSVRTILRVMRRIRIVSLNGRRKEEK